MSHWQELPINESPVGKCIHSIIEKIFIKLSVKDVIMVSKGGTVIKNPPTSAGDKRDEGPIPKPATCPEGGNGKPLQYSCWKSPWTEEPSGLYSPCGYKRAGHD